MTDIFSPKEIIDRLRKATSATSDSELARLLGVSQQAVSSARKGKVPDSWPRIALARFGISADWLYTGKGPMLFDGGQQRNFDFSRAHAPDHREPEGDLERRTAEQAKRIKELEAELETARKAERAALLEANAALKRLLPHLSAQRKCEEE